MNKKWNRNKELMIEKYTGLLASEGDSPAAIQMSSEGQEFRFKKLLDIGCLEGRRILDIGCGRGDFYPYLKKSVDDVKYTGVDIVPDLVQLANNKYPEARFLCKDLIEELWDEKFDYIFISMVFNHKLDEMHDLMKVLLKRSFNMCSIGLGFNFVSSYVNYPHDNGTTHDPVSVFEYCIKELSNKVNVYHHYDRCDVGVFVYH